MRVVVLDVSSCMKLLSCTEPYNELGSIQLFLIFKQVLKV